MHINDTSIRIYLIRYCRVSFLELEKTTSSTAEPEIPESNTPVADTETVASISDGVGEPLIQSDNLPEVDLPVEQSGSVPDVEVEPDTQTDNVQGGTFFGLIDPDKNIDLPAGTEKPGITVSSSALSSSTLFALSTLDATTTMTVKPSLASDSETNSPPLLPVVPPESDYLPENCKGDKSLTLVAKSGYITSPGFENNQPYPPNISCNWQIEDQEHEVYSTMY